MYNLNTILNHKAKFIRIQNDIAYYVITVPYSELLYSFPVPIKDIHDEYLCSEKSALFFSRHIHQAIHDGTFIKEAA